MALRELYEAACSGDPKPLWGAEEVYGADVVKRLFLVGLLRVPPGERVLPTFGAALQLQMPEVETARSILLALRDQARAHGVGFVPVNELVAMLAADAGEVRRALCVVPSIAGAEVACAGTRGFDAALQLTPALQRWNGALPTSPVRQRPQLEQMVAMHRYGVREFVGVTTGSVPLPAGADLTGVRIEASKLTNAPLVGAVLDDAVIESTDMSGAVLRGASLRRATLRNVLLGRSGQPAASLREANFDDARLEHVEMRGVDLADASLRRAVLRRVMFEPCDVAGAMLDDLRFEDRCGFDFEDLARDADFSILYIDGVRWHPTGPDLLRLERRDLGWAVIVRGVDRGAVNLKGCAGLAALAANPDTEFHVLDLERAELGKSIDAPGEASVAMIEELAERAGVTDASLERVAKLQLRPRVRLVAVLRYLVALNDAKEVENLQMHVAQELGGAQFQCTGAVEVARKRAVGKLRTAVAAISEGDGSLRDELRSAFELREFCCFRPDRLRAT